MDQNVKHELLFIEIFYMKSNLFNNICLQFHLRIFIQ